MSEPGSKDLLSGRLSGRRGWVFDMDGTLLQPAHDFQQIRRQLGIPPSEDILDYIARQTTSRAKTLQESLHHIEMGFAGLAKVMGGAEKLLQQLAGRGVRVGILTRNSLPTALCSLEAAGLDQYFHPDDILGRDQAPAKPRPDGVSLLMRRWQLSTRDMVVVGDFLHDLEAGRAAGAFTVHLNWRQTRWPDVTDLEVRSLDELLECL